MPRWFYALLLLVPVAVVAHVVHLPDLVVFILAAASLIPLAGLLGIATQELAYHVGPRLGGLLNATFGNAAELIIALTAVQSGLLTLVKASITGAIIGNTLFILGMCLLVGGLKHREQTFSARYAGVNSAMMILAVAALFLPAVFSASSQDPLVLEELSLLVAGVLLMIYAGYLGYTVLGRRSRHHPASDEGSPAEGPTDSGETEGRLGWSRRHGLLVLSGATVGAAVSSEILVSAVEPMIHDLGLSEVFAGVIVVALVGSVAEQFTAVQMAWRNRLDVSLAIAAGSSTQIALFVAPVLAFVSLPLGHPLDLIFSPLELAVLGVATALFAYISVDGESNWLEGVQLLGIYAIAACAFFLLPVHPG